MKILKRILIVLGILVAAFLITGLFVKQEFEVERMITINKPKSEVFDYIRLLKNQNEYSAWAAMDPNMKKTYTGTDGTVGFVSAWDSQNEDVGQGEQKIVKITEGERIDYDLHFIRPFEAHNQAYLITESVNENQTNVKWGFKGKMNYPFNVFSLFMNMEKMVGDDLDKGLNKLQSNLEK